MKHASFTGLRVALILHFLLQKSHRYSITVKDAEAAAVWDGDERRAAVAKNTAPRRRRRGSLLSSPLPRRSIDPRLRRAGCLLRHDRTGEEKAPALRARRVAAIGGEPRRGGLARPQNLAVCFGTSSAGKALSRLPHRSTRCGQGSTRRRAKAISSRRRFLQADVGFRPNDPGD